MKGEWIESSILRIFWEKFYSLFHSQSKFCLPSVVCVQIMASVLPFFVLFFSLIYRQSFLDLFYYNLLFLIKFSRQQFQYFLSYQFRFYFLSRIMRPSKSCEDIRIQKGYCYDQADPNSNYFVTNFKSKPCQRQTQIDCQTDAYELAKNQVLQDKHCLKLIPTVIKHKNKYKKTVSQDNIQKLLSLQNKAQLQAYNSLCDENPFKFRNQIMCSVKQLSKMKFKNLKGSLKRIQMTKNVMIQAVPKSKQELEKNKPNQTYQSSQWSQSLTNRTFQTSKTFINEQISQKKTKNEKENYFKDKLMSGRDFNELFETQRRKQCWKGFMEAQRNQVKQNKGKKNDIKLGLSNPNYKKRGKNRISQDDQGLANYHYAQYQMNRKLKGLNQMTKVYGIILK